MSPMTSSDAKKVLAIIGLAAGIGVSAISLYELVRPQPPRKE